VSEPRRYGLRFVRRQAQNSSRSSHSKECRQAAVGQNAGDTDAVPRRLRRKVMSGSECESTGDDCRGQPGRVKRKKGAGKVAIKPCCFDNVLRCGAKP